MQQAAGSCSSINRTPHGDLAQDHPWGGQCPAWPWMWPRGDTRAEMQAGHGSPGPRHPALPRKGISCLPSAVPAQWTARKAHEPSCAESPWETRQERECSGKHAFRVGKEAGCDRGGPQRWRGGRCCRQHYLWAMGTGQPPPCGPSEVKPRGPR